MTDIYASTLTGACHRLLLRLAGRVPDGLLSRSRAWLAAGEPEQMASAVASHAATTQLALAEEDAALLGWILTGAGRDIAMLARIPIGSEPEAVVPFVFAPAAPEVMAARAGEFGPCLDLTAPGWSHLGDASSAAEPAALPTDRTEIAVEAAAHLPGAAALWRAWRSPADGSPWPPPRRVFLFAVAAPGEPFEAAAALADRLAALGETDPLVEAFDPDDELPAYHRTARARAALLWTPDRPAPIRLAPVYDTVAADGTPSFAPDRPRLDPAERDPLAAALDGGRMLMSTTARLDDVLDPANGRGRVPAAFRTDGTWVWSDAVTYYLRTHGVAPVADLLSHLRTAPQATPDAVALFRATAALTRPTEGSR